MKDKANQPPNNKQQKPPVPDQSSNFFFELMPCTLEALTVIKTFCLWLAIPTYWRIGESKKPGVFQIQNKTNPTKNKTKTSQEDTQGTRWDTTLSEKKSSGRSVLLHDVIANLANRCPKWLQVSKFAVIVGGGPASSQSLNKGEELVHPRPRRWSCARQEFHWYLSSCHNTSTRKKRKVVVPAS